MRDAISQVLLDVRRASNHFSGMVDLGDNLGFERLTPREREILRPLLRRTVGRSEPLPERVVVPDLTGPEHDLRQLLRPIDHEGHGPAHALILEHAGIGPHAHLAMSRGRE